MTSNTIILYPVFLDCRDFTLDDFWKDIFMNCAQNKFPRGVRYDEKTHTLFIRTSVSSNRTKTETIELPKTPKEIFKIIIELFKEKLDIYSTKDLQIKKKELEEIEKSKKLNLDCEWKKLKPRSLRDYFIMDYIVKLKEKYNLSAQETKNLLTKIKLGFQFKELKSSDVKYSKRKINSISGLTYNTKTREFKINNKAAEYVPKNEKVQKKQKFQQALDKFIKERKNKRFTVN